MHVNVNGEWKAAKDVWVHAGGSWRKAKGIWVHSGGSWRKATGFVRNIVFTSKVKKHGTKLMGVYFTPESPTSFTKSPSDYPVTYVDFKAEKKGSSYRAQSITLKGNASELNDIYEDLTQGKAKLVFSGSFDLLLTPSNSNIERAPGAVYIRPNSGASMYGILYALERSGGSVEITIKYN